MAFAESMLARWQTLPHDQRRWLVIGSIVVTVMLYWGLFWDPMHEARITLRQQVGNLQADVIWLQQLQPAGTDATASLPEGKTLLRIIDETLRAQGMAAGIERIEPSQSGTVRVVLRAVPFDRFAGWLAGISQYAVSTEQLSVQKSGAESGLVDVRLQVLEG